MKFTRSQSISDSRFVFILQHADRLEQAYVVRQSVVNWLGWNFSLRDTFEVSPVTGLALKNTKKLAHNLQNFGLFSYRTSSMTHSNVALDIQSRWSSEPERFHVCVNLSLKYSAIGPRTSEPWNQFVINGTAELID